MRNAAFKITIVSMDHSRSALQVALRVLRAISQYGLPDSADVGRLRRFMPSLANLPDTELACGVIHHVVELRAAEARKLLGEHA